MGNKNILKKINSIPALLAKNFKKFAKKPAMILDGGRTISYNDMRWDIFKTSNTLRFFSGVTPKTVAVFIDNSPQTVETLYSVLAIGAKAVLLKAGMEMSEIQAALLEQDPDVIFIRQENIGLLPENCSASILEIADNRVLKKVDPALHGERIKKAVQRSKDESEVLAVTYSHGTESSTLTRGDLALLVGKASKKGKNEKTFDALVEYVGSLITAFLKGRAVQF